jgi:hypothetical protein
MCQCRAKSQIAVFFFCCVVLQEIVSIYPMLSPPTLTAGASNRVCNALALLQVGQFDEKRFPCRSFLLFSKWFLVFCQ